MIFDGNFISVNILLKIYLNINFGQGLIDFFEFLVNFNDFLQQIVLIMFGNYKFLGYIMCYIKVVYKEQLFCYFLDILICDVIQR